MATKSTRKKKMVAKIKCNEKLDYLRQHHPDAIVLDPRELDDAITGINIVTGQIVYDYKMLIECFMRMGFTEEQSIEVIETKAIGMLPYIVEQAPIIMETIEV